MKYILLFIFLCTATIATAQKFVLLDQRMAEPVKYVNKVTSADKFNKFFPVEKKLLPEFLKTLAEIENKLLSAPPFGKIAEYKMGCIQFTGRVITLASGERIDYVISSSCDDVNIFMHLSDAKLSNKANAFFIKTWISYIENNVK